MTTPTGSPSLITLVAAEAGRLDRVLATAIGASRALVQEWIRQGAVTVNGAVTTKPAAYVQPGDRIEARALPRPPLSAAPEDIPIKVVYEDDDLLVVAKPAGMPAHPAPGHPGGTLVNALLGRGTTLYVHPDAEFRPGIVHRLDKDTSGLLMVAKTELAYRSLAAQLREHSVKRVYQALVHGVPDPESGVLAGAIGRHPVDRVRLAVVPPEKGKPAITHYRLVERFTNHSLLELRLATGRTHQIRVHLSTFGHPVAGDPLYCPPHLLRDDREWLGLSGQALHAGTLGFVHPRTGEFLQFTEPLPPEFARALEKLRKREAGER
ncbi:MAG: RluA family pseudouridine synthase [Limnochordales bacterium]|nr:RluA family pseudouridine synthase [Limnochordales bacterium]